MSDYENEELVNDTPQGESPTRRPRSYSPQTAPPGTPAWLIIHKGKSVPFIFEGSTRTIQFGKPQPFRSFREFQSFAQFVENQPDFHLVSSNQQDPVSASSIQQVGPYISYMTVGQGGSEPCMCASRLNKIHARLWVVQLPWEPIPLEYRTWLKPDKKQKVSMITPVRADERHTAFDVANAQAEWDALMESIGSFLEDNGTSRRLPELALNTILYGSPGTGKTYSTAARAVEIITGKTDADFTDRAALMSEYRSLSDEGRIAFVTFHQSYGYEDFIEGIRPVMDDDSQAGARYECRAGTLKQLAVTALGEALMPVVTAPGKPLLPPFRTLWNTLLDHIQADQDRYYDSLVNKRKYQLEAPTDSTIYTRPITTRANKVHRLNCGRERMATVFAKLREQDSITNKESYEALGKRATHTLFVLVFSLLKQIEADIINGETVASAINVPPTPKESAEIARTFLQSGKKSGYQVKDAEEVQGAGRYVLIIDEINRGNVSKILGELITLLEDDKRLGAENELIVTLPVSGERFALPPNLYIIGTMNTADKSIALVDVALRRRFDFEELAPDFGVCTGLNATMRGVLEKLNQRITIRLDRDHRIGHAYFAQVKDADIAAFNRVFHRKIVPLLQEFFYNDWDGVREVLGETGTPTENGFVRALPNAQTSGRGGTRYQWYTDVEPNRGADFDALATLAANYKLTDTNS